MNTASAPPAAAAGSAATVTSEPSAASATALYGGTVMKAQAMARARRDSPPSARP